MSVVEAALPAYEEVNTAKSVPPAGNIECGGPIPDEGISCQDAHKRCSFHHVATISHKRSNRLLKHTAPHWQRYEGNDNETLLDPSTSGEVPRALAVGVARQFEAFGSAVGGESSSEFLDGCLHTGEIVSCGICHLCPKR
jgi:hypothetical protein